MRPTTLAKRYAHALADVAEDAGRLKPLRDELDVLAREARKNRLFAALLSSPRFTHQQRRSLIQDIAEKLSLDELTIRFLGHLAASKRLELLEAVREQFSREADRRLGVQPVSVCTAVAMNDPQKQALQQALRRLIGKEIRMRCTVDETLISGFHVRAGNRLYDGSLLGQLRALQERMSHVG